MEELEPYQDDFSELDKYIIGFTENQYSRSNRDKSPSPVDLTPRHSSLSQEYAERSNKNAENVFQDQSILLDKQKNKSMNKINGNRLDLVFELTERRKLSNPQQRPIDVFSRLDSQLSDSFTEFENPTTSPIFPTIQVQQLPPLTQPTDCVPKLPHIDLEPVTRKKVVKKNKKGSKINVIKKEESAPTKVPKLVSVVQEVQQDHLKTRRSESDDNTNNDIEDTEYKTNEVLETSEDHHPNGETNTETQTDKVSKCVKWRDVSYSLIENMKLVKENINTLGPPALGRTNSSRYKRPSFCQSSYQERADRERAYNIRRRHSLQTKTGPLDFNKLRRQISFTRSKTII